MKLVISTPTWAEESPWLDETTRTLFRDEFRLIADIKVQPEILSWGSNYTPIPIYQWIYDKRAVDLFYRSLARFAPMFRVTAYKGQTAIWISPPPSGLGNAIYLVIGHDGNGKLRSVGGNFFTEPVSESGSALNSGTFFKQYDQVDQRTKQKLVRDTVQKSILPESVGLVENISSECAQVHTMAIYITALTEHGSLFHAGKAVIEGVRPADFSYEFFGEVK